MSEPVYFETSAILELINAESRAPDVRDLIAELKKDKIRIYTSVLTVHEASILSFRRGSADRDVDSIIAQFARIVTIDRAVAIKAARLEAAILDFFKKGVASTEEARHRRRWDCLHIATAQVLGCSTLYAFDKHFRKRTNQVDVGNLRIAEPKASQPNLNLQPNLQLVKRNDG
jgi:predicted nucleic acid-binding protein